MKSVGSAWARSSSILDADDGIGGEHLPPGSRSQSIRSTVNPYQPRKVFDFHGIR